MKKFALTGAAGYIAPRHLKAIKETGNELIAATDPHDSVGILDSFFPQTAFFTEFERFDRHLEKIRRTGDGIDYLSICTPNNLHDAHIRLALRVGADAICEKPLVLNPWNLDALQELEEEFGKKVYNILQLRVHPALVAFKERMNRNGKTKHEVNLKYITSRGPWYHYSWKGDLHKSGGIATNIGIHFFDLLMWFFGPAQEFKVDKNELHCMSGSLELQNANVNWFLSIDSRDLPEEAVNKGMRTFRSIKIDDEELEFTGGFTDLHTLLYKEILEGRGFGLEDARPSIELVHRIRSSAK